MDLLLKSKTAIGVLLMVVGWLLGPESEPVVLNEALSNSIIGIGAILGGVGARDALRKIEAKAGGGS